MLRTTALRAALAVCIAHAGAVTLQADDVVRIDVEFLADGRCAVTAEGEGVHAALTYARWSTSADQCAVPPSPRGRPVALTVRTSGARPVDATFPRLTWVQRDGHWIGTASLPAAPAFVRVPRNEDGFTATRAGTAAAARESSPSFGWNFYGWFLFSAAFLSTYFLWAWRMARRDARRVP